ncbi:hypothetical protein NL676_023081 [Syzygium grande]|nr:hypothetical protein NL676_023081 [Syzygium grande]
MNIINEQIAAAMSKMMSDLMAKQQQINAASQSEIPPPTRQGLRLDKAPTVNTNPTFQLDDAILTDISASLVALVLHSPPNDENAKLLVKLDQSQLIVTGEEIESGLKKGWYSESDSSGKRFTSKKDKKHVPEVNMTYVLKMPAQAPATIYHPADNLLWAARPAGSTPTTHILLVYSTY